MQPPREALQHLIVLPQLRGDHAGRGVPRLSPQLRARDLRKLAAQRLRVVHEGDEAVDAALGPDDGPVGREPDECVEVGGVDRRLAAQGTLLVLPARAGQ